MNRAFVLTVVAVVVALASAYGSAAEESAAVSPDEQLTAVVAACEAARGEFDARAAEESLYDRLGGRAGIRPIFVTLVEILSNDPEASKMLEGVDLDRMVEVSTDHLASHTGGTETYRGRDITEVHKPLNIDAEKFLAAGAAFGMAMQMAGVPADLAQEVQCLMIGMRDQVMAPAQAGS